ncbi:MAG: hypothetical protein ACXVBK_17690, partial [Flavisolibacter sp.]
RSHHCMPGKQAGSKTVQEDKDRFTLPHLFDMHGQTIYLNKQAIGVGQLLRRDSVGQCGYRDKKWSDHYQ